MRKKDYYNSEGYADPTPYHAQRNIEREEAGKRFMAMEEEIHQKAHEAGFDITERIQARDRKTGRLFK